MADTRNVIYSSAGTSTNQNCESKDSSSKSIGMKVNSTDSSNKEANKESDGGKPFLPPTRTFPSKSESSIISSRLGSTFGTKSFTLRQSAFGSSKFGSGSASCTTESHKPIVLRPSQLAVGNSDPSLSTSLKSDSQINNPFARVAQDSSDVKNMDEDSKEEEINFDASKQSVSNSNIAETSLNLKLDVSGNSLFSPSILGSFGTKGSQKEDSSAPGSVASTSSGISGFVFGQNLLERVEVSKSEIPEASCSSIDSCEPTPGSSASTNGTSEMLFSSVIQKELGTEDKGSSSSNEGRERPCKSLSEAAREYEEARNVKRKYEEVTVVTGEEDEANVLQLNCKLFAFNKLTSAWVERGRGNLRLNDMDGPEGLQSRVVIRTTGSLRVVLNTKIWAGMVVDQASAKSIRLTAMDNSGQIKVFLVMATPTEIEQLYEALRSRVASKKSCKTTEGTQHVPKNEESESCSSSTEPPRKRPSLVQDAGGGNRPEV